MTTNRPVAEKVYKFSEVIVIIAVVIIAVISKARANKVQWRNFIEEGHKWEHSIFSVL